MNLVNGYIFRLQGFCLFRIIYKPRERILSAHGVCRLKYLIGYRFFGTVICLPMNTQCSFSTQKLCVFCADFPIVPAGAAICRPPKCEAFFRYTPRICAVTIAAKLHASG